MSDWFNPLGDPTSRTYPPPPWKIQNWFLNEYQLSGAPAIHTGDDINLPGAADVGEEVRAIGEGEVVFAALLPTSTWLGLVVIRHDHDGTFTCSRYGHLTDLAVLPGQKVSAGQVIGKIVEPVLPATFQAHLHFDIGKTGDELLRNNPKDWPRSVMTPEEKVSWITAHYQNPGPFLQPRLSPPGSGSEFRLVINDAGLNIRATPSLKAAILRYLPYGSVIEVKAGQIVFAEGRNWLELVDGQGWASEKLTEKLDTTGLLARRRAAHPHVTTRRRGVNIDLNVDRFSPPDLTPLGYCRFVYDLSQETGSLDWNRVFEKFDARIRHYIASNVTPIIVLNQEFYGEGAGFDWNTMADDSADSLEKWSRLSDKLAELTAYLARTYGHEVVYQIWNEADQGSKAAVFVPPAAFADMLDKAITKILDIAPRARIITSGLVSGKPGYWAETQRAMQLSHKLAGVGLHAYGRGRRGPEARYQWVGTTRQLLDDYARITNHKFWITEWGVTGDPAHSQPPGESERNVAAYIREFLTDVEQDSRVEAAIYFAYMDGMHNTYGLYRSQDNPKPLVWSAMTTV